MATKFVAYAVVRKGESCFCLSTWLVPLFELPGKVNKQTVTCTWSQMLWH